MIEFPSMSNLSKSPRETCIAFDKLDGSNIRVKYNRKKGFHLFGSRHQLFDETHPFLAGSIPYFMENYSEKLERILAGKEFSNIREVIAFGEYFGEKSFAGFHLPDDNTKKFVLFDLLIVYKDRYEFLKPQKFIKLVADEVEIPRIIYEGNLNDPFIQDVKDNKFNLSEGVICKGTETKGSYCGKVWMCKIKTKEYLDKLRTHFKDDWEKYAE